MSTMEKVFAAYDDRQAILSRSANPYAQGDIPMMQAEGGKYYNLVQITGVKR